MQKSFCPNRGLLFCSFYTGQSITSPSAALEILSKSKTTVNHLNHDTRVHNGEEAWRRLSIKTDLKHVATRPERLTQQILSRKSFFCRACCINYDPQPLTPTFNPQWQCAKCSFSCHSSQCCYLVVIIWTCSTLCTFPQRPHTVRTVWWLVSWRR